METTLIQCSVFRSIYYLSCRAIAKLHVQLWFHTLCSKNSMHTADLLMYVHT